MGEWQTIETAPKDGTVFLAYWRDGPQFVAWVDDEPRHVARREGPWWRRRKIVEVVDESGFRVLMPPSRGWGFGINGGYAPFTPTHWMPRPTPPA
jgi:hypothetical protein